jgi:hypothetical protein
MSASRRDQAVRWFAVFHDHIPKLGNHLATDQQVGEGAMPRLDAGGNIATRTTIVKGDGEKN